MKRIIFNLILFIFSVTVFGCIYIWLFKISVTVVLIALIILTLYSFCMGLEEKSIRELKKYEKKLINSGLKKEDYSRILLFSLTTLSPSYFCVIVVSMIPIVTHEVWFITVFPCILLNCLPASMILDEYYGLVHKKLPFIILFLLVTVIFCFIGAAISRFVFR